MVEETTHLVTPCCGHVVANTDENKRWLADNAEYVAANPYSMSGYETYRWNCWGVWWTDWGKALVQFLSAIEARKRGDIAPLKEWTMKKESRWWTQKLSEPPPFNKTIFDYKMTDYADGEWPEDVIERLMGVDVQADRFEFVIRDFRKGGKSRLVYTGTVLTWGELAHVAAKYRIQNEKRHHRVIVDCGERPQEVWRECAKRRWLAVRGKNDRKNQMWPHGKSRVMKPWSTFLKGHNVTAPRGVRKVGGRKAVPTFCPYIEISDVYFQDWLSRLAAGDGIEWQYADDVPEDYVLDSVQVVETDGRRKYARIGKRPDHKRDCEKYILPLACILGVFEELPEASSDEESESEPVESEDED